MKKVLTFVAALSISATASAAQLSSPSDFPAAWKTGYDESCVAKNGKQLTYRVFSQAANDDMRKTFGTIDVNGVRIVQLSMLSLGAVPIGLHIEVQKGDHVLQFEDLEGALNEALGMSKNEFHECFYR